MCVYNFGVIALVLDRYDAFFARKNQDTAVEFRSTIVCACVCMCFLRGTMDEIWCVRIPDTRLIEAFDRGTHLWGITVGSYPYPYTVQSSGGKRSYAFACLGNGII